MPLQSDAAGSREIRKIVSEFKKRVEGYLEEETDKIVDEAVTAVRSEKKFKQTKLAAKA